MNVVTIDGRSSACGGIYLRSFLRPLAEILAQPEVTDIYVNQPGEIWVERVGGLVERKSDPDLSEQILVQLARQVAAFSQQGISREHPLISAVLPDGCRIQVVAPPATRGPPAVAIRKQIAPKLTLKHYADSGAFGSATASRLGNNRPLLPDVVQLVHQGNLAAALGVAVRERLNIMVSGGTSSGKTTFLNALIREIPGNERLILIEDTKELQLDHPNHVGLIAVRGPLGEAQVSANDLVSASLRLRPDRIILGELRGSEALAFLRAINSGHPGSMTTIHADSPEGAVEQLVLLALEAGTRLTRADIRDYASSTIDIFVQVSNVSGVRGIERLAFRDAGSL